MREQDIFVNWSKGGTGVADSGDSFENPGGANHLLFKMRKNHRKTSPQGISMLQEFVIGLVV